MLPSGHPTDNFNSLCKRQILILPLYTHWPKLETLAYFIFYFSSPLIYNYQENPIKYSTSSCILLLCTWCLKTSWNSSKSSSHFSRANCRSGTSVSLSQYPSMEWITSIWSCPREDVRTVGTWTGTSSSWTDCVLEFFMVKFMVFSLLVQIFLFNSEWLVSNQGHLNMALLVTCKIIPLFIDNVIGYLQYSCSFTGLKVPW